MHTECDYMKPIEYPEVYLSGMAVTKIGNSSVTYKVRNRDDKFLIQTISVR